jgi:hypothetical protein
MDLAAGAQVDEVATAIPRIRFRWGARRAADAFRLQLYSLIAFAGLAGGLDGVGNVTTRDQSAVCPFDEPYAHAVITLD